MLTENKRNLRCSIVFIIDLARAKSEASVYILIIKAIKFKLIITSS